MKIPVFARWGVVVLTVAMVAAGCSNDSNPLGSSPATIGGDNSLDQIDLNQEYGGLAYTDEPVAFGDDELLNESMMIDQNLTMEDDEDSVLDQEPTMRDHPRLKRTMVRILWGQLDGIPDSTQWDRQDVVDWSGELEVSGGVLALKRTIRFERPIDHLLPRDNRHVLRWQSFTGPHFDGLLVCVLQRPDSSGVYPDGSLILRTGPYSTTLSLADLDSLSILETVDNLGNAISIEGRTVDARCPAGFLRGFWAADPGSDGGLFRGIWVSRFGMATGFVQGRWGINGDGERVFAGKIISRTGEIRGLLQGRWELLEDGKGVFQGRWAGRFGNVEGALRGEFRVHGDGGWGFFRARWQANCEKGPGDGGGGGNGMGEMY